MIEKIEWLWKEADKVCHAMLHATIVMAFAMGLGVEIWYCWFISIAWGVFYELYDHARQEGFDWRDITANFVGMFYGTVVWLIVLLIKGL